MRRVFALAALAAAIPALAFGQAAMTLPQPKQPAQQQAPRVAHIEPANQLERTFINALTDETLRPAFRRQLLSARVAVAMNDPGADARPLEFPIREGWQAVAVFTSSERLNQVLGPNAPRRELTGREAFALASGKNIVINPQLSPMLTLEMADVATWLQTPAQ